MRINSEWCCQAKTSRCSNQMSKFSNTFFIYSKLSSVSNFLIPLQCASPNTATTTFPPLSGLPITLPGAYTASFDLSPPLALVKSVSNHPLLVFWAS